MKPAEYLLACYWYIGWAALSKRCPSLAIKLCTPGYSRLFQVYPLVNKDNSIKITKATNGTAHYFDWAKVAPHLPSFSAGGWISLELEDPQDILDTSSMMNSDSYWLVISIPDSRENPQDRNFISAIFPCFFSPQGGPFGEELRRSWVTQSGNCQSFPPVDRYHPNWGDLWQTPTEISRS